MKIKWGAFVTDGRGKIGGHVASKNASGAYFRTKVTPSNPSTSAQTAARQLFAAISSAWASLSQAVRDQWDAVKDDWAQSNVFGDQVALTGKALYQRLNNQAQSAGFPPVTEPPQRVAIPEGVMTEAAFNLTDDELTLTGVTTSADARLMIFATEPLSVGRRNVKNQLRLIDTQAADSYSASDAYAAYAARFGDPAATDAIHIGVKTVVATGQASPMQIIRADIS